MFLYREVLHQDVQGIDIVRARKPKRLPVVLTKSEALRVLSAMSGVPQFMAKLLYGNGSVVAPRPNRPSWVQPNAGGEGRR